MLINGMSSIVLAASLAAGVPATTGVNTSAAAPMPIRMSLESVARESAATEVRQSASLPRPAATNSAPRRRSVGKVIVGVLVGGTVGFFAGGYTGIAIENKFNPCHCDDPGLKGAIIGAPIGAVVGAIAGGLIAK
jgi:hypothetical protein